MRGQPIDHIFVPEDVEAGIVQQEMATAGRTGRAADERWHVRKSGDRFWASGELMPLRDPQGAIVGFVKIVRDRTEQRRREEELRQLNDALTRSEGKLQVMLRDLEFLAQASEEIARLSDYESTLDRIAHLAVPHFADWCTVDLLDDGGQLQRVAVAHADPAKEELARELYRRFPHDPDRVIGGGPLQVLRTGRAERVEQISSDMLRQGVREEGYLDVLLALGLQSYLGVPLAVRGRVLGVITFVTAESHRQYTAADQSLAEDLARRAAVAIENAGLLRALQESDRAKDVFLATLAHELRNPLAPVWNGLTIIKRKPDDAARVRQVADMIERQVGQLSRLVDDLLDVSRITAGKIELKKERVDISDVLRTAIETSRPHIEAARHQLTLDAPRGPCLVEADPARLAQVFSNLLNNAAKYTRPGGRIEVEAEALADTVRVSVRDNGAGIAPEMLSKVFTLFTQVRQPPERTQGGLGIGLSLVDGLVKLHQGTVEARSAGVGHGSEFIVTLPRLPLQTAATQPKEAPKTAQARQETQSQPESRRVLVVDDNQDAATTLAELLRLFGSDARTAHDGQSAVRETEQFRPDIVLLDIGLPDMNGYEVARLIRQLPGIAQPRLVALTGWGQEQDKQLAAQAGFDEHWTKPVDPAKLQALTG
jgi:signal transduction histidine kinase/CheY-like chemotaxis protein